MAHLRVSWGFDGYIISDADAVSKIAGAEQYPPGHGFASSYLQASTDALFNGTTISLECTNLPCRCASHRCIRSIVVGVLGRGTWTIYH